MNEIEYTVIVHEDEDGGYWTEVPALPGTGSQGDTLEEAVENTKEAITLMVEYLRDKGEPVPIPRDIVVKVTVAA
jgi:predicted RNase H-like HicB family nuclease